MAGNGGHMLAISGPTSVLDCRTMEVLLDNGASYTSPSMEPFSMTGAATRLAAFILRRSEVRD